MHQESGGEQQATSPVGAMGLMQVMPATYEELRVRYQLGDDPYEPRNNIMAGTAYIREMYDRFGAPGFLAAYNAGPDRVAEYLAGRAALPDETVNYVAAITPNLGTDVPRSGPFAVYAAARSDRAQRPTVASLAAGCDLNAAYNPDHPCTYLMQAAAQPAPIQTASAPQLGANGCDLNAAYNPDRPCTSLVQAEAVSAPARQAVTPQQTRSGIQLASVEGCDPDAAYNPARPCHAGTIASGVALPTARARPLYAAAQPTPPSLQHRSGRYLAPGPAPAPASAPASGGWAIQVGAFKNPGLARAVAEGARAQAPHQLRSAALSLPPTAPFGNTVLYRARLGNLSANAASAACTRLNQRQLPCVVVPPSRS
jgi:cell division septation protein DedD